jgi:outer membrane receptor protein involved in Fe transport
MKSISHLSLLAGLTVASMPAFCAAQAPGVPAAATSSGELETVVIVGSRIRGTATTEALPVTVIGADEIAASGAVDGDELMRTIPEMGDVFFNSSNQAQTSNTARGDITSIDLRGAGIGNTLVLLNGRRLVAHPTSNGNNTVPLLSFNSSAIPAEGLERVEILRDGAGAIYGSDAVAGVINTVMKTNFEGYTMDYQYGLAEGTHRKENVINLSAGKSFADSRGNVSAVLTVLKRGEQLPSDMDFTRSQDKRYLFAGTRWANSAAPDGRGNQSSWANATVLGTSAAVRQGTTALTSAAGAFHIQPNTLAGCAAQLGNNLCLGTGGNSQGSASPGNILRYDNADNDYITISPSIDRQNFYANAHFDLADRATVYGEFGLYHAQSHGVTTQPTSLVAVGVPASNYWNPFGPVTFADGTANPNRLPNLTNVPAEGRALTFANYRFNDFGRDHVDVENFQYRYLVGLQGQQWGFDWDSAVVYSYATAEDISEGVDSNLLLQKLALSTPDAYNPFNGSCLDGSGGGDCTPSNQSTIDDIRIKLRRFSKTGLTMADLKASRPDLFSLPGGMVGVALGLEQRQETQRDDRDPHVNGSLPFVDTVTGQTQPSSATGVNVTPSTRGSRDVFSTYLEFAVPVISPEMSIPLVKAVNMQLAGRYEHYSDFGDVAKPKIALAWDIVDDVRLRASWQKGFRAPNLETTADFSYGRASSATDYVRCEADIRAGRLQNFNGCARSVGLRYFVSGNPDLGPETSESTNVGLVFEPSFLPDAVGSLTLTVDRWTLDQVGGVGVYGVNNQAILDYLARINGSANSDVIRAAPNADGIALFAGTGLQPVGVILDIRDKFRNLAPQQLSGWDFALNWQKLTQNFGRFAVNIAMTYMDKFDTTALAGVDELFAARDSGLINPATPLDDGGNRLRDGGRPEYKGTATFTWKLDAVTVGVSANYVGSVLDTALLTNSGEPWRVDDSLFWNTYGQYNFDNGVLARTKIRIGARNVFNTMPPLSQNGYNAGLYNPYGRYLYANVGLSF